MSALRGLNIEITMNESSRIATIASPPIVENNKYDNICIVLYHSANIYNQLYIS